MGTDVCYELGAEDYKEFPPLYNGPLSLWHNATTTPHNALNATEPFQQQSFPVDLTSYADDAARTSVESNAHTFATQQNYNDSTLAQQLSVCNLCPNESKKEMLLLFMGKGAQTEMRSVFQKTVQFWGATKANTPKPNTVSHDEKYMHTKSIPLSLRLLDCLQNYNTSNSSNSNTLTVWPLTQYSKNLQCATNERG